MYSPSRNQGASLVHGARSAAIVVTGPLEIANFVV